MADGKECSTKRMFEKLTSVDSNIDYTEGQTHRPLLYASKEGPARKARRRTDTDICVPKELLRSGSIQDVADLSSGGKISKDIKHEYSAQHQTFAETSAIRKVKRQQNSNAIADRQRRQTVAVDGIYFAKRVMSVEDNEDHDQLEPRCRSLYDSSISDDADEFFLATDFDTPLPKSGYTQSVDYLDSLIKEEQHVQQQEDFNRRCHSVYDVQSMVDESTDFYTACTLEKGVSPFSSTSSLIHLSAEGTSGPCSGADLESLPPESLDGSWTEDLCPSPLDLFYDDINDWTPSHDPDVIHSAREARDFMPRESIIAQSCQYRSKSEPYLLEKVKSLSQTMLADSLDMDDIDCHVSFRHKIRAVLGLDCLECPPPTTDNSSSTSATDFLNTSLTFRTPHKRTTEPLHTRLRRVLSSVSINSEQEKVSFDDADELTTSVSNTSKRKKDRLRTKSVPADVTEFVQSFNDCDSPYYEKSKSAEVLNHLGAHSAFRLYHEDAELIQEGETYMPFDEEERFIDSPLVVDYQLGLRNSPPPHSQSSSPNIYPSSTSISTRSPSHPSYPLSNDTSMPYKISTSKMLINQDLNEPLTPVQTDKSLGFWDNQIIIRHKVIHTPPPPPPLPIQGAMPSPPPSTVSLSTVPPHSTMPPCSTSPTGAVPDELRIKSCDEEVKEVFSHVAYNVVRAEPMVLGATVPNRSSVVHATPVMIGTPCHMTVPDSSSEPDNPTKMLPNSNPPAHHDNVNEIDFVPFSLSHSTPSPQIVPMGQGYSVGGSSEFLTPDTLASDINLYMSKPWDELATSPKRVGVPRPIKRNSQYAIKLSDMEIVCDGKTCRLVPSDDSKSRKMNKLRYKKKRLAPLPPIDEDRVLDSKSSEPKLLAATFLSSSEQNDKAGKHTIQAISKNNEATCTYPNPPVLDVKDMDWVTQHYDVTGELGRMSGVSEIEYML